MNGRGLGISFSLLNLNRESSITVREFCFGPFSVMPPLDGLFADPIVYAEGSIFRIPDEDGGGASRCSEEALDTALCRKLGKADAIEDSPPNFEVWCEGGLTDSCFSEGDGGTLGVDGTENEGGGGAGVEGLGL